MTVYEQVFSEFEVKNSSMKFPGETAATKVGCVGSLEETLNQKTVTKKCEGVVKKSVTKGDGTGELAVSLHIKYDLYVKAYGMDLDTLKEGVYAYGQNSRHKELCWTCEVLDEDGVKKLKAYPNCVITSGVARKIENGGEEVAEIEMTISIMPDEYGNGMYEAIVTESLDKTVIDSWLTNFTPELVQLTA